MGLAHGSLETRVMKVTTLMIKEMEKENTRGAQTAIIKDNFSMI